MGSDDVDMARMWATSLKQWSSSTPHVIVVESRRMAIETIESSALCTTMIRDQVDMCASEWLHVEWTRQDECLYSQS
jgi:hypothetical protein